MNADALGLRQGDSKELDLRPRAQKARRELLGNFEAGEDAREAHTALLELMLNPLPKWLEIGRGKPELVDRRVEVVLGWLV